MAGSPSTDETHVVTVERLVAGGDGLASLEGLPIFIPFVAPGETAVVRITERHTHFARATVVELLTPSADRATPPCPVFGRCGGCQWQHLSYAAQCRWKQQILAEQLQRIGKISDPTVLPTIAAPSPWHYRSRIKLQVDNQGRVGFFRAGSYDAVEFDECLIADQRLNAQLRTAKASLRSTGRGRELRLDEGKGFAQVNPEQNRQLQDLLAAGAAARGGGRVLELFCGNGNLTFPLASVCREVVGVEAHAPLVHQAITRGKAVGVTNITFKTTAAARYVRHAARAAERFDGVVLDPPRCGATEAMADLLTLHPRWIAYVSCDPATLARDLRTLCAGGYTHISSQPIDMFPQTFHIESVTWMATSAQVLTTS